MSGIVRIDALGVQAALRPDASVSPRDLAELRTAWGDALGDEQAAADLQYEVRIGDELETEPGVIIGSTIERLASYVTSTVTLGAIEHHRGDLLMLHACAVALPDGRVVAFAGPSGSGKSTLARVLGRSFGYVTDETVAVHIGEGLGTVAPYRKPLSLVRTGASKLQVSPGDLGLLPLPSRPLDLAALVVIDRARGAHAAERMAHETPLASFDDVERILELAMHTSYLSDLPSPLHALSATIEHAGGLQRVRYREAEDVIALIPEIVERAEKGRRSRAGHDGAAEAAAAAVTPGGADGARPEMIYRAQVDDWLRIGSSAVSLRDRSLHHLQGIAPALWEMVAGGATMAQLAESLVRHFGDPPDADPYELTAAAVQELTDVGLLVRTQEAE